MTYVTPAVRKLVGDKTADLMEAQARRLENRCPVCNAGIGHNCIGLSGGAVHAGR